MRYQNPDNDPRGPWKPVDYWNPVSPERRPNLCYDILNPNTGRVTKNTKKAWKYDRETHATHLAENRLWWGIDGKNTVPALKLFLSDVRQGMTPHNWWPHEEVGHTDEAKKESLELFGPTNAFDTPKPERLLKRILELSTGPGDLVLDSFAGSGTTGAVAHKMGRRWIMVELGASCETHIIPRLHKVSTVPTMVASLMRVDWKGGGGFRYYRLAPSLLAKDEYGNWVVNKQYNAAMLAEAVCKLEGYRYAPSTEVYWQHGHSSEDSFIYVTTQTLVVEQLRRLNDEVGPKRGLLICCGAFTARNLSDFPRLTLKKIPKAVLHRCEWGHDDYSLEIRNLPAGPAPPTPQTPSNGATGKDSRRRTVTLLSYGET